MKSKIALIVAAIIIGGITLVLLQTYVSAKIASATEKNFLVLEAQIAKQDLLIAEIVELLRTSGADEVTERIVVDCPAAERARFDQLLDQLQTAVTLTEINELETLFYKCGSFYPDRKSIMAARLAREVEIYAEYVRMYANLNEEAGEEIEERAALWRQVAEVELRIADLFNQLAPLQEKIIVALKNGQSRSSSEIQATLKEVANVRIEMSNQNAEVIRLREELSSL